MYILNPDLKIVSPESWEMEEDVRVAGYKLQVLKESCCETVRKKIYRYMQRAIQNLNKFPGTVSWSLTDL